MTIGQCLFHFRQRAGLTQVEHALAIRPGHWTQAQISKMERDERAPSTEELPAILAPLGVSVIEFYAYKAAQEAREHTCRATVAI